MSTTFYHICLKESTLHLFNLRKGTVTLVRKLKEKNNFVFIPSLWSTNQVQKLFFRKKKEIFNKTKFYLFLKSYLAKNQCLTSLLNWKSKQLKFVSPLLSEVAISFVIISKRLVCLGINQQDLLNIQWEDRNYFNGIHQKDRADFYSLTKYDDVLKITLLWKVKRCFLKLCKIRTKLPALQSFS